MKVILIADVKGRGNKGQIIDVANGYGNYLLTNKLAIQATDENIKQVEAEKEKEKEDAENHYHISVIYEDDTEESHYYVDNLVKNSQNSLRDVLIKYIDKDYLIDAVLEDK